MTDLALFPVNDGDEFDAALLAGDFIADDSIRTAVLVSLLSDAEDLTWPDGDPRGWSGDAFSSIAGDRTGSLLWELQRAKADSEALAAAIRYAKAALQWMLDDGVASSVDVSGAYTAPGTVQLTIAIVGPQGQLKIQLAYLWQQSLLLPNYAVAPSALVLSLSVAGATWDATLNWTPSVNAASYVVYAVTTPGQEQLTPSATSTTPSAVVMGLALSTTYFFRVVALDANGSPIGISPEISGTTGAGSTNLIYDEHGNPITDETGTGITDS